MKRHELEHIIRAAGSITGYSNLVCIGSQAILGSFPSAPSQLLTSMEADIFPLDEPDKSALIEGSIGELSPFHETFGYYAHGVSPDTAVLPVNWKQRLVVLSNENTHGYTGLCLSPVDIAVSKLAAGRDKDILFVSVMIKHSLISEDSLRLIIPELPEQYRNIVSDRLNRCLPDKNGSNI